MAIWLKRSTSAQAKTYADNKVGDLVEAPLAEIDECAEKGIARQHELLVNSDAAAIKVGQNIERLLDEQVS